MSTEKILDRVRKMMALANDAAASEGERENALRMSYNLLAKHNLSMVDVDQHLTAEQRQKLETVFVTTPWARLIAQTIAGMFFCNYVIGSKVNSWKGRHYFIGKESNATTAMLMSEYVITSVLKEARKLYKDDSCPAARSFAVGVARKLSERVKELIAEQSNSVTGSGSEIVLASLYDSEKSANVDFMSESGFKTRTVAQRGKGANDQDAFNAGKSFGSGISLAPQVSGSKKSTLLLG